MMDGYEMRFETIRELTILHDGLLRHLLHTPRGARRSGFKPDKSSITLDEYKMGMVVHDLMDRKHPEDSIRHEEMPLLFPDSEWELDIDPVDPTKETLRFDPESPEELKWSTSMLSYVRRTRDGRREPEMFGLAVPLLNQDYWGSVRHGLFLNNRPVATPSREPKLIIGVNEPEHRETFVSKLGYENHFLAGPTAWLMLQGDVGGGAVRNGRPYEINCIIAIARIQGATITDERGAPYDSETASAYTVWSLPHIDHGKLLKRVSAWPARPTA